MKELTETFGTCSNRLIYEKGEWAYVTEFGDTNMAKILFGLLK